MYRKGALTQDVARRYVAGEATLHIARSLGLHPSTVRRHVNAGGWRALRPVSVRPTVPIEQRLWPRVNRNGPNGCWIWTGGKGRRGYGRIQHEGRTRAAHCVAYELTHGPIENDLLVCHTCDNPPCVNPAHLFLGTAKDNTQDALRKGRMTHGEKQWTAKLTAEAVIEIRHLYAQHAMGARALSKRFGVCETNIWCIVKRETWKHLP
jgi:hypothetical protein